MIHILMLFLVFAAILAFQDFKTRRIDNVIIFLLWFPAIVVFSFGSVAIFVSIGLINEIMAKFKSPICGWGDVLIIGPFFAMIYTMDSLFGYIMLYIFSLCLIIGERYAIKIPLASVFFLWYLITMAYYLLFK